MSHDNAAIPGRLPIVNTGIPVENGESDFTSLTDRELMEAIYLQNRDMQNKYDAILAIATEVQKQVEPLLNSPMLKMFRK